MPQDLAPKDKDNMHMLNSHEPVFMLMEEYTRYSSNRKDTYFVENRELGNALPLDSIRFWAASEHDDCITGS